MSGLVSGVTMAAGPAGAKALKRTRSLAEEAPMGRLFASIATLTETARSVAEDLAAERFAAAANGVAVLEKQAEPVPKTSIMGIFKRFG